MKRVQTQSVLSLRAVQRTEQNEDCTGRVEQRTERVEQRTGQTEDCTGQSEDCTERVAPRTGQAEHIGQSAHIEQAGHIEHIEQAGHIEQAERTEQVDHTEQAEQSEHIAQAERTGQSVQHTEDTEPPARRAEQQAARRAERQAGLRTEWQAELRTEWQAGLRTGQQFEQQAAPLPTCEKHMANAPKEWPHHQQRRSPARSQSISCRPSPENTLTPSSYTTFLSTAIIRKLTNPTCRTFSCSSANSNSLSGTLHSPM